MQELFVLDTLSFTLSLLIVILGILLSYIIEKRNFLRGPAKGELEKKV